MFDIGSLELVLVALVALVVVGPKELPGLLRAVAGMVRRVRGLAGEFRRGLDVLADEVAQEADPFRDERAREGVHPGMTPEEITEKILANRRQEAMGEKPAAPEEDAPDTPEAPQKAGGDNEQR